MMARYFVGLGLAACLAVGMLGCHSYRDQYGDDGRYASDCGRFRTQAECDRYYSERDRDARERADRERALPPSRSEGGASPFGR